MNHQSRRTLLSGAPICRDRALHTVSFLLAVAAAAVVFWPMATQTFAAQDKTVWDGVYTQEQAARGAVSFSTYCARCHDAAVNDGEEGKSLAGRGFWQSYRESTVDHLLNYVSQNMPNGRGGSLAPNVYADVVAFILSRNDLPAGQSELTKDSAVGVKIIAKTGPGELPGGTLVRVVGCVARKEGGGWLLTSSTDPERASPSETVTGDATVPLGSRSYVLLYSLLPLDPLVGHRVRVRGLLIGDGGRDGINVSETQSLSSTCQ